MMPKLIEADAFWEDLVARMQSRDVATIMTTVKKALMRAPVIEAGRLVRMPCKEVFSEAGNNMFMVFDGEIIEVMHCGARVDPDGNVWAVLSAGDRIFPHREPDAEHDTEPTDWCRDWTTADAKDFGTRIFPTEAEARTALGKEVPHEGWLTWTIYLPTRLKPTAWDQCWWSGKGTFYQPPSSTPSRWCGAKTAH